MSELLHSHDWPQLKTWIDAHHRFLISSHIRPDGDAIGSSLAFKRILHRLGKDAIWVMDEDVGISFDRFYEDHELQVFRPDLLSDREMMVMVDAGEWYRLGRTGEKMRSHPGKKICIDHHIPQNHFDGLRILDVDAPSTTVLMYRFIRFLDMRLDFELAEPIYLGLIVDTQNLHLPNTTEEAHLIAAQCLHAGVKPQLVHEPVFGTTLFSRLRLMSQAFQTLEIHCQGNVGIMHTSQDMFREAGADSTDDDGFVDLVRSMQGVRIGIYLREEADATVKVSWRAKGENSVIVSAQRYGGGGHLRAAGATIPGSIHEVISLVLKDMEERFTRGEIT